jgi:hypothetical protein
VFRACLKCDAGLILPVKEVMFIKYIEFTSFVNRIISWDSPSIWFNRLDHSRVAAEFAGSSYS